MAFQATLTGNIGREPEIRYFESGKCKVELTVAIKQRDKDAPAFWVQVDMWNKQAEFAQNYLHKGDTIFAQGTVTEETFTRRNGEAGHKIVLVFAQVEILKSAQPKTGTEFVPSNPQPTQPPATQGVKVIEQKPTEYVKENYVPEVDEIPF
tara:strand:+ start:485 stop:937 length:453 start_codon:yes stop_codon:yes gene_type:complete